MDAPHLAIMASIVASVLVLIVDTATSRRAPVRIVKQDTREINVNWNALLALLALTVKKNAMQLVGAATSLLAPAIKDVSPDGKEMTVNMSVMVICMEKTAASHVATVRTINNVITLMELV